VRLGGPFNPPFQFDSASYGNSGLTDSEAGTGGGPALAPGQLAEQLQPLRKALQESRYSSALLKRKAP
jgi:hypothetical protein